MRNVHLSTASLSALLLLSLSLSSVASAATLTVGPTGMYPTPCLAVAAAVDNDVIEIDSTMTYEKDYCVIDKNGLTLMGVGGARAKIDAKIEAAEVLPAGNAIWVVSGSQVKIQGVELTGAIDSQGKSASAIHVMGKGIDISDCSIHNNDAGLLVDDDAASEVAVQKSEFFANGIDQGDDPGHITVGKIAKLMLTSSYLHHGIRVTMVKSSAAENHILYNRITSEPDGTSRLSLDIPLGGLTYVIGNVFHRAQGDEDTRMIVYRQGQGQMNPSDELFIVNNTFVSDNPALAVDASFDPAVDTLPVVRNNIFAIPGMAEPVAPKEALEANNFKGDPMFIDQKTFDLHLQEASPCVDKGMAPGMAGGFDLAPKSQYLHVAATEARPVDDPIDIGAYEIPAPPGTGGGGGAGGGGTGGSIGVGGSGMSSSSSSSSSSGGGGGPADDGGCGCRTGDAGSPQGAALVAFGIALLYGVRRRQRC